MDKANMIMARGGGDELNLAIGEPVFIQDATDLEFVTAKLFPKEWQYQSAAGAPHLKNLLEELNPGCSVVVTNGAKQALAASFYALKYVHGTPTFSHKAPYWPSMPSLVKQGGAKFTSNAKAYLTSNVGCITTSPSNPLGVITNDHGIVYDVWDAVYNSEVYQADAKPQKLRNPAHLVKIDSVSKRYGFSGLRLGWAIFNDPDLAEAAASFVESTTSGVSIASQKIAHATLLYELKEDHPPFDIAAARQTLNKNVEMFDQAIIPICDYSLGLPAGNGGMFAYFHVDGESGDKFKAALDSSGVKLIPGSLLGETEDGWWRMSLGQSNLYTEKVLEALTTHLQKESK